MRKNGRTSWARIHLAATDGVRRVRSRKAANRAARIQARKREIHWMLVSDAASKTLPTGQ